MKKVVSGGPGCASAVPETIAGLPDRVPPGFLSSESTSFPRHLSMATDVRQEPRINYDRARYYDAALGSFMGQDPKGFAAGDRNLYGFVGNGPTDATDPSGMIGVFYPPVFTPPAGWPNMPPRPAGPKWSGPLDPPANPGKGPGPNDPLPNNTGGTYPTSIHWTPDPGVGTQEQWDWWRKNWLPYKRWVLNQRAQQQEQQYQAALQAAAQMQAELNAIMAAQQAEFAAGVQWLQNLMQQQLKWAQIYLRQAQAHLRNPFHTPPPSMPGIIGGSHPGGHGTAIGPGAVAAGGGGAVGSTPFSPHLPGSQGTP